MTTEIDKNPSEYENERLKYVNAVKEGRTEITINGRSLRIHDSDNSYVNIPFGIYQLHDNCVKAGEENNPIDFNKDNYKDVIVSFPIVEILMYPYLWKRS